MQTSYGAHLAERSAAPTQTRFSVYENISLSKVAFAFASGGSLCLGSDLINHVDVQQGGLTLGSNRCE